MPGLRPILLAAFVTIIFCGCRHLPNPMNDIVAPGQSFDINPRQPWNLTGLQMQKGERYHFRAEAGPDACGRPYLDKSMPCTPDGPVGAKGRFFDWLARDARCPLNPAGWFGPGAVKHLRVLQDRTGRRASFLTVVGVIGRDDRPENAFVIGREREVVAHADGELVVFCNDWPGGTGLTGEARFADSKSYANNCGMIRLTVEKTSPAAPRFAP